MEFKCNCGETKTINKQTIVYDNGEWVTKEALCSCGKYMEQILTDEHIGIPNLKRTEESLSKNKRHDRMWKSTKEKLLGERGINDDFN